MSTQTNNLQMIKPDINDYYDINIQNENLDKIDAFCGRTDNPHKVTKSQIGLENVDNTSDMDKPISTAMQTALNQKLNISDYDATVTELVQQNVASAIAKADKVAEDLTTHSSSTGHITSAERNAWNAKLDSSGTASKAIADGAGNNIADTYVNKSALTNNIGVADTLKLDFEKLGNYFRDANSNSLLILTGFVTERMCSISVSGYVDVNTAMSGKLTKVMDDSLFNGFFKQINLDFAVLLKNGTVRTCTLSVVMGSNAISEFVFTKGGVQYKTYNYNDYGNDSSYTLESFGSVSGVEIYFQNMLDATSITYPLVINTSTCRIY